LHVSTPLITYRQKEGVMRTKNAEAYFHLTTRLDATEVNR